MKKNIFVLFLLSTLLASCGVVSPSRSESEDMSKSEESSLSYDEESSDSQQIESQSESVTQSEEQSEEESISEEQSTSESTISDGKYLLNAYGDYVKYADPKKDASLLATDYSALTKKIKNKISDVLESNYEKGILEFFNIENKVVININITNEELQELNNNNDKNDKESYRICSLDIEMLGMVFHYEGVGIRQKGNTSRGPIIDNDGNLYLRHYKISFEETFDDEYRPDKMVWDDEDAKAAREDREFFGLSKIDLRWNRNMDETYLCEYYSYEIYRSAGSLSQRSNPINLRMNIDGEDNNLGIYLAVESVTKSFIKRNFVKDSRNGDLYKLSWGSGEGATFNPVSDRFFGVEKQIRNGDYFYQETYTYDLKTNKDTSDHSAIKSFINDLNEQHGVTAYEFMNERSLYKQFVSFVAASFILGDPDDLRGNNNNTYVYFTGNTKQMVLIPVDADRSLGVTGGTGNPTGHHSALSEPFELSTGYFGRNNSNLFHKCIFSSNSTTIRSDYLNAINDIADSDIMKFEKFKECYDLAESHYGDCTITSNRVLDYLPDFSYQGDSYIYTDWNLDVKTYLEAKVSTIKNYTV